MKRLAGIACFVVYLTASGIASALDYVVQEKSDLPVTTFNLTFRVGSADDPKGFEGLAEITAEMLREGGVKAWGRLPARSRAELEDAFYPLAADIEVSVAKEQTAFRVTASADTAMTVFDMLMQMLLAPAFDEGEFTRLKAETLDALQKQLPREDQEELGKAALEQAIYGKQHPYSHVPAGSVKGLKAITLDKVRSFYATNYTRRRLTVGVAGVVPKAFEKETKRQLKSLPEGTRTAAVIPPAPRSTGLKLLIVKGPFEATGVHLGHAESFNRGSPDFPAMYLAANAFGKHRSFVGRLMKVVREIRGLNYGTYAYVEDFPHGGQLTTEPTQVARQRQAFTMWGRPTKLENGCFLLKQMLREATSFATEGLRPDELDLTQSHLVGTVPLLGTGIERRLAYAVDGAFYGIKGDYLAQLQKRIKALKRDAVNAAIKRNLDAKGLHIVVVTPDPEKFRSELLAPRCDIHYPEGVTKPQDVKTEDEAIATFPVPVKAADVTIVTAEDVFSGG